MTATYIPLATLTLTSTDSEIVFSSIPATYRDLVLVINGGVDSGDRNVRLSLNSDTTDANYAGVQMSGSGSSTSSTQLLSPENRYINYFGYMTADLNTVITVNLFDYAQTNKHKTVLSRSNNAGNGTSAVATRWANTNAVTSVAVGPTASTFRIGSRFSLYGIN